MLTQPKRFGIDISDYTSAIRSAEDVDFPRRYKLYDLYSDILMDSHLSCVIEKRRNAVLCSDIEFRKDGKPDETVNEQIRSPWFSRLVSDIIDSRFWGFTLCQFFKDGEWVDYNLVPRKHVDPVRRIILRHQTDITGIPWDEYSDLLFVGRPDDLGLLAKAAPWVIYKRNTTGDWSQFSEIFGMPIQEYTYDTDDDSSRERAISDASNAGSLAVFVHGKDTALNLIEAGNKTGSADVYERLCERCNNEISKLILGNTLTTESSDTGTQALGTVHKKGEDKITQADRLYVLDVLNYDMSDIFASMGIDTTGGKFCYPEKKDLDPTAEMNILTQLKTGFGLPIDDDFLYEKFGISKPADYASIKREEGEKIAQTEQQSPEQIKHTNEDSAEQSEPDNEENETRPDGKDKKTFKNRLKSFFVKAPSASGAALDW
ncbi:MAG: DUF935 domain-containing protein [Ruminococcus flavefaciens]|nr:DUF935 domain-containing protein [Ruminococcus flavefaciens]